MPDIPPLHPPKELHARHDRVRLTILLHRKQGMSTEDFQKYWRDEHSQLFANLKTVKRNLLTYEQVGVMPVVIQLPAVLLFLLLHLLFPAFSACTTGWAYQLTNLGSIVS